MKACEQRPTISSGLRGNQTPYPLNEHRWERICYAPEQVGQRYGSMEILSPDRAYKEGGTHAHVLTTCLKCDARQWVNLSNLRKRRRDGCQSCPSTVSELASLTRRFADCKARCDDPQNANYGGRGIRFLFDSPFQAAVWMRDNHGMNLDLDIDRVDNEGNYEPGNIRWSTRSQNNRNNRRTVLLEWDPQYWPYGEGRVRQLISEGLSREDILEHANRVVDSRGPWWKTVERRLQSMTYSMPENVIVSQRLES